MSALYIPFFDSDSFDPLPELSSSVIVADSDDEQDAESRKKKRQRIEDAAKRYLTGEPLLIQTASLRGPFDSASWKNPWKKTQLGRRNSSTAEPRSRHRRQRKLDYGTDARFNSKRQKTRKSLNTAKGDTEFSRREMVTEQPGPISASTPKARRGGRPTAIVRDQRYSPEVILVDPESLEELCPINTLIPAPNRRLDFSGKQMPGKPEHQNEAEKLEAEAVNSAHSETADPQASAPTSHGFTPINKSISTRPEAAAHVNIQQNSISTQHYMSTNAPEKATSTACDDVSNHNFEVLGGAKHLFEKEAPLAGQRNLQQHTLESNPDTEAISSNNPNIHSNSQGPWLSLSQPSPSKNPVTQLDEHDLVSNGHSTDPSMPVISLSQPDLRKSVAPRHSADNLKLNIQLSVAGVIGREPLEVSPVELSLRTKRGKSMHNDQNSSAAAAAKSSKRTVKVMDFAAFDSPGIMSVSKQRHQLNLVGPIQATRTEGDVETRCEDDFAAHAIAGGKPKGSLIDETRTDVRTPPKPRADLQLLTPTSERSRVSSPNAKYSSPASGRKDGDGSTMEGVKPVVTSIFPSFSGDMTAYSLPHVDFPQNTSTQVAVADAQREFQNGISPMKSQVGHEEGMQTSSPPPSTRKCRSPAAAAAAAADADAAENNGITLFSSFQTPPPARRNIEDFNTQSLLAEGVNITFASTIKSKASPKPAKRASFIPIQLPTLKGTHSGMNDTNGDFDTEHDNADKVSSEGRPMSPQHECDMHGPKFFTPTPNGKVPKSALKKSGRKDADDHLSQGFSILPNGQITAVRVVDSDCEGVDQDQELQELLNDVGSSIQEWNIDSELKKVAMANDGRDDHVTEEGKSKGNASASQTQPSRSSRRLRK